MKRLLPVITLFSILSGCSSVHDIEYPHPMIEHKHPFPLAQYQVQQTETTQAVLSNRSDDVTIRAHSEYVIWERSDEASHSLLAKPLEEASPVIPADNADTPSIAPKEAPTTPAVDESDEATCKVILCSSDSDFACGTVEYCDGEPCLKHIDKYYDCNDDNCLPKYLTLSKPGQCSHDFDSVNPDCMGKGEGSCAKHPELFMCNSEMKRCGD